MDSKSAKAGKQGRGDSIVMQVWASLSEEDEEKTFWPSADFLVQYFCNAFLCH